MTVFFLKWRLNVDEEYQAWILLFASILALNVFCLPCHCAGSGWSSIRRLANFVQQRLPYYLLVAAMFNVGLMYVIVEWMPDWEFSDYTKCVGKVVGFLAKHAVKMVASAAMIGAFIFVVAFKDRFLKVAGIEKNIFRFKLRDVFGSGNLRAIEIQILKVEDVQNKSLFAANNIFVEANLGYNEPMKTRVFNNAGTSCSMKSTLQLNFDDEEEEEVLYIVVRNQKVVGAEEIGRKELTAEEIVRIEKECATKRSNDPWAPGSFVERELMPRGKIYFRIQPVDDEDQRAVMC